jgi:peroxiredoxin (alkyl hydroperoxide reductase subunit C)
MAAVAVKYPAFQELGAEVLTISVDGVARHQEWNERELARMVPGGARYPMLSDPHGKIGKQYGVYDDEKNLDLRGRFLIDPSGIVQAMEILGIPVGRDVSEILRELRAFQQHQKTGELIPCGWQPGKPILPEEEAAKKIAGKVWEIWKPRNAF